MTSPLQIVPTSDWSAVYAVRGEEGGVELIVERVACWALVEDKYGRSVVGYSPSDLTGPVENVEGFVGYVHDEQHPEELLQDGRRMLEHMERSETMEGAQR